MAYAKLAASLKAAYMERVDGDNGNGYHYAQDKVAVRREDSGEYAAKVFS